MSPEHFVTLFDRRFLPQGLALHESLRRWAPDARLWVVCMDAPTETALRRLALDGVVLIPLRELETPALLAVKGGRTTGEYCWTLTPFVFPAVFDRDPSVSRVTYLDADLFFFADPKVLLEELDRSEKSVLVTEHAYDPVYDVSARFGRFCVQFLTFDRTEPARRILDRWRSQCLEWCYGREDSPGRFGDQMYLDEWPGRFGEFVHVLKRTDATLAPWNVKYFSRRGRLVPVFYHFHGFRILSRGRALLYSWFRIGKEGRRFYDVYLEALRRKIADMERVGAALEPIPLPTHWGTVVFRWINRLRGKIEFSRL